MTATEKAPASTTEVLAQLLGFLKQHLSSREWWRLLASVVLLVSAKIASLAAPWLLGRLVGLAAEGTSALFAVMAGFIAAYAVARLLETLFGELKDSIFATVIQHAIRSMARKLFAHLHSLPLEFHLSRQTGGLALIIERGTKGIEFIVSSLAFNFGPTMITLMAVCFIFWGLYGASYALATAVSILCYSVFTIFVSHWRIKFRRRLNTSNERISTQAVDSLLNHETVKLFSAEERELDRFDRTLSKYERDAVVSQWTLSLLNLGQMLIITACFAGLLLLAARDVDAGLLGPGDLATLNAYLLQMFLPLGFLGTVYRIISQSLIDVEKAFSVLNIPSSTPDRSGAKPIKPGPGKIEFDNVSLDLGGRRILDNITFTIPAKKHYAIVGETGSGKTTITRLLARLLDPDSGVIKIDGENLRDVTQRSIRKTMATVPQDAVMFNDTLRVNLAFGAPEASDKELLAALATAGLSEFAAKLPEGLETQIGERGLKLSGGERQRLAIARAQLLAPRILIMDEATSALDAPTEAKVKQAMEQATVGRTTLTIAHRLSTVTDCDQILVLDEGKLVETGSHDQLLEAGGHYEQSWRLQSRAPHPAG